MAEILKTPLTVLHAFCCLFLMLTILIQPGKSGGMGALTGGGATQVFGGRGAGTILTKITWVTAALFFITSLTLAYLSTSTDESLQKRAKHHGKDVPAEAQKPATPPASKK
jgi:preprotein translocase subunit SecG